MRTRSDLHKSKLVYFKTWLRGLGWEESRPKGFYEVLRMTHDKYSGVLLVYDRNEAKEHYTTFGISDELLHQWLREKQRGVLRIGND